MKGYLRAGTSSGRFYVKTGEFRAPKAGEYYLSGSIPEVYQAGNDFSPDMKFHIMHPE